MTPSIRIELIPGITTASDVGQVDKWRLLVWLTIDLVDDDGNKQTLVEKTLTTDVLYDTEATARFASRDYVSEMAQWTGVRIIRD